MVTLNKGVVARVAAGSATEVGRRPVGVPERRAVDTVVRAESLNHATMNHATIPGVNSLSLKRMAGEPKPHPRDKPRWFPDAIPGW